MDRSQEIARKVFFSLCISAFTITTKFGIQIMCELNVRHNSRKCFSKVVWLWKKHSGKNRNVYFYYSSRYGKCNHVSVFFFVITFSTERNQELTFSDQPLSSRCVAVSQPMFYFIGKFFHFDIHMKVKFFYYAYISFGNYFVSFGNYLGETVKVKIVGQITCHFRFASADNFLVDLNVGQAMQIRCNMWMVTGKTTVSNFMNI